jgi:hypothetical protein
MSDEEEDFSSDESSGNEDFKSTKPGLLTLEDNDEDSKLFQRPDINDMSDDGGEEEGEDDDEFAGEDEDDTFKGTKSVSSKKTSKSNNVKTLRARNSNRADSEDSKKNKKKRKKQIGICVTYTKYDCVRRVGKKMGFKEVEEHEDWALFWTDTSVSIDRVNQMKKWQKNKSLSRHE